MWKHKIKLTLLLAMLGTGVILKVADFVWPLSLPETKQSFSTVVLDRDGQPLRAFADDKGIWRYQVKLNDVSPLYIDALLTYEDRHFYRHPGINPFSLLRAMVQNIQGGRIVSGGSTLTMQVARILHPHSRTIMGKLQQVSRTLQLEWHLTKTEILELYLNYAPFGGTIEGVQAASYQYLQKPASELRRSEAALLAVLPQLPSWLRPDRHPKRAEKARNKVLDRMAQFAVWEDPDILRAKKEHVGVWSLERPMMAPLLARRMKNEFPQQRLITTTINTNIQRPLADLVRSYAALQGDRISAAVMIVDNTSHEVSAYVGSSDFSHQKRAGYVDMTTAIRSPGSTLKPFLFGLSIDEGLIHSHSLLADVPRVLTRYKPGNFSKGFSGPVSATEALQRSLNIPFVQLIEAYGAQKFVNRLSHVRQPLKVQGGGSSPAVILGGAGTSLERLVTLYSSLANQGQVFPLKYEKRLQQKVKPRRLMSRESAWITLTTLQGVKIPRGFDYGLSGALRSRIAWKTGTSWGHRDVWAIGVTPKYTVGVWLGQADGQPLKKALGMTVAGPLLFSAFSLLEESKKDFSKPNNVQQITVCWPDGRSLKAAGPTCDVKHLAYTKAGTTPPTLRPEYGANFHQPRERLLLSIKTNKRVLRQCADGATQLRDYTVWPVALEPWLPRPFRRTTRIPDFDVACSSLPISNVKLRMVGMTEGQIFHILHNNAISIPVRAEGKNLNVTWYLDSRLIATNVSATKIVLSPNMKGKHDLIAVDTQGAIGRVKFTVY
jgi:penicillin-binding protein 1C